MMAVSLRAEQIERALTGQGTKMYSTYKVLVRCVREMERSTYGLWPSLRLGRNFVWKVSKCSTAFLISISHYSIAVLLVTRFLLTVKVVPTGQL